ncbi:serine/threonine protein phosphatase [Fusibacter bizertensis]|uniref:Serine/threonine protein phosphatase n=1 Tax=Fusibacter bizertensis TaxID=1488331 RepID=A0ABT6NA44_9FIRM|nr:serine/threonine protein phosphatase [Fusibacter bizertensis]MDH8677276.1 serine/threonine protein phosphatase [Fusibacter bizertensis]
MFTSKKLLSAYEKATKIPFDEHSKYIFFSDVHRGDNSLSDEFAHNQNIYNFALQYYLDAGFTYIEVGDGDELWEQSNFQVIRYAHSDVFMILRQFYDLDRFIMLYGNHNMAFKNPKHTKKQLFSFYDEYKEFFSELFPNIEVKEAVVLENKKIPVEIFVVHGHQGDFINDQIWPVMRLLNRYFWRFFHIVGLKNPASPAKNAHKRHKIEKNYSKFIAAYHKTLIVGHTHRPKFPKPDELPYFNTGCCIHPRNITGIEIENNHIALIEWRISPSDNGTLQIIRRIIRGPRPLSDFASK